MAIEWQICSELTERAKFPGGWFVRHRVYSEKQFLISTFFYPDPTHDWDGKSLPLEGAENLHHR